MTAPQEPGSNVLVVSDDVSVRVMFEHELEEAGFAVTSARDESSARAALQAQRFAVVVSDIRLPKRTDGVRLTRWVKQYSRETEIVLITDRATVESAAQALRLGARDYLVLPLQDTRAPCDSVRRAALAHAGTLRERQELRAMQAQRALFSSLFDKLTPGVLLLSADATILHANATAQRILDDSDWLRRDGDGRLVLTETDQDTELQEVLRSCVGGVMSVDRRGGRPPISVFVSPFDGISPVGEDAATVAVFISDPDTRMADTDKLLQELYHLTRAEAAMACSLIQGNSVQQAARERCVSMNTARTHLKRIFAKTGTSRQGELACLLLSGPALVRARATAR